jgi:hypothetical protein
MNDEKRTMTLNLTPREMAVLEELAAAKDLSEFTGRGQLQILVGLFGDDWNGFGAQVNLDECGPETLL